MLDIEIFAFFGRCCHQASVLEHFHTSDFYPHRTLTTPNIYPILFGTLSLLVETNLFSKFFD